MQIVHQSISIPVANGTITGDLNIPTASRSVVLFAHGSGSSRRSPRNKYVAEILNRAGFSTLLMDLLTAGEDAVDRRTAHIRFDIDLLAERLAYATDWIKGWRRPEIRHIGYFGASTGAAAALVAAAKRPKLIEAVVSRGGRPDLAGTSLSAVRSPTLLIAGELDDVVIELNRRAAGELRVLHKIEIVPGATHLFEEPGTLEQAARLSREWFAEHLVKSKTDAA